MCTVRLLFRCRSLLFFFFNDTATTEIYTLSLHDALPIYALRSAAGYGEVMRDLAERLGRRSVDLALVGLALARSEEHTSELQSQSNLVCRLLLGKKKIASGRRSRNSLCGTAAPTSGRASR